MRRFSLIIAWFAVLAGIAYATDISVTAGNVVAYTSPTPSYTDGNAGETITAGQVVYLKTSDNEFYKADCDATAATAVVHGIALNGASDGQPIRIQKSGDINPGGTVVVGKIYVLSGTAGGIAPVDDLAQGDRVSILGVGVTSSKITLKITNSGVQVP